MAESTAITIHCLIATSSGRLFLCHAGGSQWALPTFPAPSTSWLPYQAAAIAALVHRQHGLSTSLLRHLREAADHQYCELHAYDERGANSGRWFDGDSFDLRRLAAPGDVSILRDWREERRRGKIPARRAPWERTGWLALAQHWIRDQVARLGLDPTGPIEPVKLAWSGSAVLRVRARAGTLYFKAASLHSPDEAALSRAARDAFPAHTPRILAHHLRRRWWLMADAGGVSLQGLPLPLWAHAARSFAKLQVASVTRLDPWRAAGCPDLRPHRVLELWNRLRSDAAALAALRPRLAAAEVEALQLVTPLLARESARLHSCGVPAAIHLADLRGENIRVAGADVRFLDWAECVIAHPFFSIVRLLAGLRDSVAARAPSTRAARATTRAVWLVLAAYLEPWKAYASTERLTAALDSAFRLDDCYQAIRWYREAERLEAGCPWHTRVVRACTYHLRRLARLTRKSEFPASSV